MKQYFLFFGFIVLTFLLIYMYVKFLELNNEPLKKYYFIKNNKVYAKMDIPEFTDLGVISIHGEGISRSRDTCNNVLHYTKTNLPWRKHRELGKYIHHSELPNTEIYRSSPLSFGLRTIKKVDINEEISTDYYPLEKYYDMKI